MMTKYPSGASYCTEKSSPVEISSPPRMIRCPVPPGSENWSAEHCVQETGALLDQAPLAPRVTSTVAPTKPALQEYVKVVVLAGAVLGSGESVALPKAGMGGRKSASASAAEVAEGFSQ